MFQNEYTLTLWNARLVHLT